MKMCLVGAGLFHGDGQTDGRRKNDMTKLIVTFRNFAKAPEDDSFTSRESNRDFMGAQPLAWSLHRLVILDFLSPLQRPTN
jgi:hypothetical protein